MDDIDQKIVAGRSAGKTNGAIGYEVGLSESAVRRRLGKIKNRTDSFPGLPVPAPEAGGPALPDPVECAFEPFVINGGGWIGVISDVHLPFHDLATINAWIADCKSKQVSHIVLNGDILDCYDVSDHSREPNKSRMVTEIEKGKQFVAYLRATFPRATIVYKAGNHEERLRRYLAKKAPELFDVPEFQLQRLLELREHGVEWVEDKRVLLAGKLPILHGHEYQGGGGVMPARWLYLRTGDTALIGHFHQPTFYTFRTVMGREVGVWSTGCACYLSPGYRPLNQWGHGWASIEVFNGGDFHVHNRRLLRSGQVV